MMFGQAPVANFSANVTSGCSPLAVYFADQSTGSPVSWNWDFGNGQLSNIKDPVIIFAPGSYSVTLVVRNANGINSITKTNFITVNQSPTVDFSAVQTLACLPAAIQFNDASVPNAGTINKWEWDFGDGGTSSLQNPLHTYTTAGYYSIYLKVTSSTGCSNANSKARYIRMVNGVKANFSFSGPSTCKPPYNLAFQNLTSGPGNLTYAWDFGNGNTSAQPAPAATYNTGGTYTVKLSAQSDFGCGDSIQKSIPINGITTSFSSSKDSICLGSPVTFQNTTSPAPIKALWTFGDGTTSSLLAPPAKTYASPGTYAVKLVGTFASCKDSVTKNIFVFGKPTVDFYTTNGNNCKAPHTVVFQNLSPDVVTAKWDFGDGTSSTSTAANVSHTYTATGIFNITLTITDSKGCTNTVTKEDVHILPPVASIGGVPGGVCVGQPFKPFSTSGSFDAIASYAWDFGDATAINTAANPSHIYAAAGNYNIKLTITTTGGCSASITVANAVQVGTPPVIDFTSNLAAGIACHSSLVSFTNLSTPAGSASVWDFGDGTSSTLFTPPGHKFGDTGSFSIKLKVTSNGCTDSLTKTNFVRVLPPLAYFGSKVDCISKTNVAFSDSSFNDAVKYGPLSYKWSFGDPAGTIATVANPTFNYPAVGTYNVQLIVNNNQCPDTISRQVRLYNGKASFTLDKAIYCRNERVTLFSSNDLSYVKTFNWVVDGSPDVTDQLGHFVYFNATGSHTAQLITTDINGCYDTSAILPFTVTGPTAAFSIANKGGCSNSTVTFNDASTSSGTLTKWVFDFGDGSSQTFTAPPFTHKYAAEGNYDVKLTVYDNTSNNCSDTITLRGAAGAVITKPIPAFSADKTVFCPNTPLQFTDSSTGGGLTYAWSFGDGGTANVQNPLHTYTGNDSMYAVKLIVTDSVGCRDSLTRVDYIRVTSPKPFYSVKDTATLCPPLETKFYFKGKDYESFLWDFGDGGGQSSLDSPRHFYNNYGIYTAKLYVTGFGGCVDSASINVNVTNPYTTTSVTFDPKSNCNDLTVNFSVIPPYSTRFQLFFGDGAVDSSQQTTLQHFYSLPNLYSPFILLSDSVGCQIVIGGIGNIDIKGAVPLFGMDKKKFCDSGSVYFADYSQDGIDKIVTRTWDFGDGVTSVLTKDAMHSYTQPGLYLPSLTVTSQSGCSKTLTDTLRILATPTPVISSVDGICNNLIIDFKGSLLVPPDTAILWKWDLSGGQTSNNQNVSVNYPDTGLHRITLEATNSLGCKGDTSKDIRIYPLPSITVNGDTSIISGGSGTIIPLTYSPNAVSFNWTPAANLSCTNCANPFATPKFTSSYNVKVTDENGCISSRNVTLIVVCNDKNFFIPNTFSPNNDGANDRFYPRGTGLDRIQALRIFNRWGELVYAKRNFPANDAASGWDGMYKGKSAATDTYIYMIDIICENANVITYKGNITLIR